jgi:histidinol-phosphate phosphatase family protein
MAAAGSQVAGRRSQAVAFGLAWLAGTAELAWARIAPGPKTAREVATMLATSAAMPFVATYHLAAGAVTSAIRNPRPAIPDAVLLDRDGTLIHDVPYNGDPAAVRPMPGAREALDRLRRAGVPLAVVSNQSGVARGLVTREQVEAVNRRVEELLGPIGPWVYCEHGPDDSCECRKPRPGLVLRAAELLGVAPERCALVGDIGADVEAAQAAGARGVLVPTPITRPEEVARADETAASLPEAVDRLIGARA